MSAISGFCKKCNKFRKRHCDGNRNTCMSILFDTIEVLQKKNEKWQKRYEELDAGHSRLYKDFCKQRQMMERYKAVLKQAREVLYNLRMDDYPGFSAICETLAEIDKAIGGKEVQKLKKSDASKEQCTIDQHGEIHRLRDELKRYKQAEQEGRLVVLPCKTEDTVFIVYAKKVLETTVDKRAWTDDDGYMLRTKEEWFKEKDIGKTVFLTREEAEKALEVW